MSGEAIYHNLCASRNLDAAVSRLDREALAAVALHLTELSPTGGVPAQIFGMISARLMPCKPTRRKKEAGK